MSSFLAISDAQVQLVEIQNSRNELWQTDTNSTGSLKMIKNTWKKVTQPSQKNLHFEPKQVFEDSLLQS